MTRIAGIAEKVEKRTRIRTTEKDIENIISCLLKGREGSHFWEVVYLAQKPFNMVAETVGVLKEEGLVENSEDGMIRFTSAGQEFVKNEKIYPKRHYACPHCERRGLDLREFDDLIKRFENETEDRPKAILDYDQGYVTSRTVFGRIALMAERGDLEGKRLLVLGDDDLVSLAAGMSGLPEEVVVLEIDDRLVNYINKKAKELNLPVKAFKYDFRESLPEEFVGAFDTFTTDPPETIEALELVMKRGLASLKGEGCAGYFGLTKAESSMKKWNEFQRMLLNKFEVAITDIIEDFNHYVNWDYLLESIRDDYSFVQVEPRLNWYRSSMYRIETVSGFAGVDNKPQDCELYVDNEALIYKPVSLTK
ncbi:MAG: bis-aminopropyl spermidine synthase family protein [Thermovenabulum sp.]|uniref:bis-aminopropyl spermidine synthase family protein n=1 Tax=Thermovenabulum sp. TaxID=3100335 RepID=UPI003C7DCD3B